MLPVVALGLFPNYVAPVRFGCSLPFYMDLVRFCSHCSHMAYN